MKRTLYFLLTLTAPALITSCQPTQPPRLTSSSYQQPNQKLQFYADPSAQKGQDLLNAAQQHLASGNFKEATKALAQVKTSNLLPNQKVHQLILKAQIQLHRNQGLSALTLLKKAENSSQSLDAAEQLNLQKELTQAYFATDDILAALNSSTIAESLIDNKQDKSKYLVDVWHKLQPLNTPEVKELYNHAENSVQRGWLALTLAFDTSYKASGLLDKIKLWQTDYFDHPAQKLISELSLQALALPDTPKRVTLLLPLNGPLAKQGQAIRNGFFAAFYQNKSNNPTPDIQVLDSSQGNINSLYKKALETNTDIIVGPLLKTNIEQLVSAQHLSVPVIALNTIPTAHEINNLYQFGLSPEDEAEQTAKKMRNNNHQRILLISPDSAWGNRITSSFTKAWNEVDGEIIDQLTYHSRKNLAHQLRVLLTLDQSKKRELKLRWLLRQKLRYTPRRRQDFDAIFLVASPNMGRQILPLLRFYYANNTPVYSISEIYQGYRHQKQDKDLNGVIFDDIPWLFNSESKLSTKTGTIRTSAKSAWPHSFKLYPRFYALGADAYSLISNLNKLTLLPNLGIAGATGTLYLQTNGQIYRQLIWAQMRNGQARLLYSTQ